MKKLVLFLCFSINHWNQIEAKCATTSTSSTTLQPLNGVPNQNGILIVPTAFIIEAPSTTMTFQIINDTEVTNTYNIKNQISYQNENSGTTTLDGTQASFTVVTTNTFQLTTVSSLSEQDGPVNNQNNRIRFDNGNKLEPTTFEAEVFSTLTSYIETTTTIVSQASTTKSNIETTTTKKVISTISAETTTKVTPKSITSISRVFISCSDVTWNPRSDIM
jgi:hypothetical protein